MDAKNRVKVLAEALPYLRKFRGRLVVIKFGGNAMTDLALSSDFERDITVLQSLGIHPIVVHGGGPMITAGLKRSGIESRFVDGVRVTDDATMDVVQAVLREVNAEICAGIERHKGHPISLTEGKYLRAERMAAGTSGEAPGRVGLVREADAELGRLATETEAIPVLAPLAPDETGCICNINADYAAEGIASRLGAEKLILMTNTAGVLDENGALIPEIDEARAEKLIERGVISAGMLPKVRCALSAVRGGVPAAHIIDGRVDHAVLLELLTDEGIGTLVTPKS